MVYRKRVRFYKGMWLGSLTEEEAQALLDIRNYVECIPSLKHVISDLNETQIAKILQIQKYLKKNKTLNGIPPESVEIGEVARGTLEDYQTVGAGYMFKAKSVLLGDEVGLGKTVQTAAVCNMFSHQMEQQGRRHRYLLLTELSSVTEIHEKMVRFTGEFVYLMPNATKKEIDNLYEFDETFDSISIVGTHSLLQNQRFITYCIQKGFTTIIFDEGGEVKNNKTLHQNLKAVMRTPTVENRYILNATPLEIELRNMYNQLDLLDEWYLPSVTDFEKSFVKRRYEGYTNRIVGYKNPETFVLMSKLRYLARTRAELNAVYENNVYKMIKVPLSDVQKELMRKTSLKYQVSDYPTSVYPSVAFTRETTPKLGVLVDLLENEVQVYQKKVLVYCRYREAQQAIMETLEDMGIRAALVHGETKNRREVTDRLRNGEINVIITTVYRSLDLGCCDAAVLYSTDGNPQLMRQFEGRITRSFDVKDKTVILLVAEGHEEHYIETELRLRIAASKDFTVSGHSMVFDVIMDDSKKEQHQLSLLD